MSLRALNDTDLVSKIKSLVDEEKKITQSILECLAEIERRRLFALRGYPSLFEFCVKELGYSESSAQRRITSMRLIKTLPEAKEKLISGQVNLSTLSQLQSFIKTEEAQKKVKLSHSQKLDLLSVIENKSQRECEKEFIKISPETIKTKESIRQKTPDLTEIKFVASKELMAKLEELQNVLAHKGTSGSLAGLIETLADMALKKKIPEPKRTSAAEVSLAQIRRQVFARDQGQCQYEDPLNKRKCLSRHKIQIDHIHPKALGGSDTMDNLRLLCATHNQLAAIQVFSRKHMTQFVMDLD